MPTENVANFAQTTLAAPLASGLGSTALTVTSASGFPATPFRIRIGSEILLVTAVAGTSWTASRAQESTSDAAYPEGELVTQVLTAVGVKAIFASLTGLPPPGRLSANTDAVPSSDVTGATTLRYLPYWGRQVWLYGAGEWTPFDIGSSGVSLSLGTLVAHANYDVFLYSNSGTPTLELQGWKSGTATMTLVNPAVVTWNSHGMSELAPVVFTTTGALPSSLSVNTKYYIRNVTSNTFQLSTLPTSTLISTQGLSQSGTHTAYASNARATSLDVQDGWLVKGGDPTRLYLGTIRTSTTTTIEDSVAKRFVTNMYHRVARKVFATQSASHTYTGAAWRIWNNAASGFPMVELVIPGTEMGDTIISGLNTQFTVISSGAGHTGIAYDDTSPVFEGTTMVTVTNRTNAIKVLDIATPGYHTIFVSEYGGSGTTFSVATLTGSVNL